MYTKIRLIIFSLIFLLNISLPGFCTELPEEVVTFIKETFPKAGVRFDGLVELPENTSYLPVLPLVYNKADKPLEITQTIPANQDFSQKPDMILFSNNVALLKIIEKKGERSTVTSCPEMPLKVKLGLLPQDLVVPRGLILSPDLKVILGDLEIPLKPYADKEGEVAFYGMAGISEEVGQNIIGKTAKYVVRLPELKFLRGKKLYTSSYKHNQLNIIDSRTGRMTKSIYLPSKAFDITLSADRRYIFAVAPILNKLFVVDTLDSEFIKTLDVGKLPSVVVSPYGMKKAFVSNKRSSSISEIDLKHMQVEREIPVIGYPDNICVMNKKLLFYNDHRSDNVYQLDLKTGKSNSLLQVKNISTIEQFEKYLFVLSRSNNTLTVFDLEKQEIVKETKTGNQPVDVKVLPKAGKILVLCSQSDELDILDIVSFDMLKKIPLKSDGYPGKIELTQDMSRALITNYTSYEIIIYNVDAEKVQGAIPVSQVASRVIISDN